LSSPTSELTSTERLTNLRRFWSKDRDRAGCESPRRLKALQGSWHPTCWHAETFTKGFNALAELLLHGPKDSPASLNRMTDGF
jgi:hypothetical protein